MKNLETIFEYHQRTKHYPNRYAASLGYMDWATQPNPFRSYHGAKELQLPLALKNSTPPYNLIFDENGVPSAPLCIESISQLFQFSLGITAYKSANGASWALRANASSGNLQPTEGYIIAPPVLGISDKTAITHYAPYDHSLEILKEFDTTFWNKLPKESFLVGLSSILWREVWKYGERGFRYTQLDLGHALHSLHVSAKMLGWNLNLVDTCKIEEIDTLFGFDKKERFHSEETEESDLLLLISKEESLTCKLDTLLNDIPLQHNTVANRLSPSHHQWKIIEIINTTTHAAPTSELPLHVSLKNIRNITIESKEIVKKRRSAQMMNTSTTQITQEEFLTILQSVYQTRSKTHFAIFIHDISDIESGLYFYLRNSDKLETLKNILDEQFIWKEIHENLYLLKLGDFRTTAKYISCSQDIAADGAFSLGMLCEFTFQEDQPQGYKELYYECGAIGQQLYLEATSLGLSATGIGCFLDDVMHQLLGIKDMSYQSLYHFTIGRALLDSRIQTFEPYLLR